MALYLEAEGSQEYAYMCRLLSICVCVGLVSGSVCPWTCRQHVALCLEE